MFKKLFEHPLTSGLDPDDSRTTELRRRIIKEKRFLHRIYEEWYGDLIAAIPAPDACPGRILELGSGGGFLSDLLPECITSEVFYFKDMDLSLDARALPFADGSLRAIIMVDVFHHISNIVDFLREAERTLAPGGIVAMWESWNTPWSRFIYKTLHPEPFETEATDWSFTASGHLSGANGALPWIVFERDKAIFAKDFPQLKVEKLRLDYPFSYLASGGVSTWFSAPKMLFSLIRMLERRLSVFEKQMAMFAFILLRKVDSYQNVTF